MPVAPSCPGVCVAEVASGVRTIASVATSIAAFAGRTPNAPDDRAGSAPGGDDGGREYRGPHRDSDPSRVVRRFIADDVLRAHEEIGRC
jgi:uncharacterized protein